MTRLLATFTLLAGAVFAAADPTPPAPAADDAAVVRLVARLGSADYATREAAGVELDALGPVALDRLREACRAANPEIARRARQIVARAEWRVGNERALAATTVELNAESAPLADILATLSAESGYDVKLSVPAADSPKPVQLIVKTGVVPFWTAVLAVCDAADLQIASVSGFAAPGSLATTDAMGVYRPLVQPRGSRLRTRAVPPPNRAIVLEPRGKNPKRPAAVYGAVLVEAFAVPAGATTPDAAVVALQIWPEPKLDWQSPTVVSVTRAAGAAGEVFATATVEAGLPPQVVRGDGVVIVRQAGGRGVVLMNPKATVPLPTPMAFTPNPRLALVRLKPGAKPPAALAELTGVVRGAVLTQDEPMVRLAGLKPGAAAEGAHPAGVEMKATLTKADGGWQAEVEVTYDQAAMRPGRSGATPAPGKEWRGDQTSVGLQVTDAEGNVLRLSATSIEERLTGHGQQLYRRWTFGLPADAGAPEAITLWGSYAKPVEVPFAVKDVPLAGGVR